MTSSKGSSPKPASKRAGSPEVMEAPHTTAPKRRGSVRRSKPAVVSSSKWSCGPEGPSDLAKLKAPDMPRCTSKPSGGFSAAMPEKLNGTHKYLPRRNTGPTVAPSNRPGSQPRGQRRGLPMRSDNTWAPRIRDAKLWRVTSTSGNSGMGRIIGCRINRMVTNTESSCLH